MSIGETLAEARQQAGLTVTQVSNATRIRETVVRAIEHDDFSSCGGNFYARGHIRSIGRAVGTDPEPLVREYDETHGGAPHALPATSLVDAESPMRFVERPRRPNWSAAMVVALVIVAIYGVFRFVGGPLGEPQPQPSPTPQPTPGASHSSTVPRAGSSPSPSQSKDPVALAPRDEVTVRLRATDTSWISVLDSHDEQLYEGQLKAGDTEKWTDAERLRLIIGNAAGVVLTVNGKKVGSPGDAGEVVRLTFEPGDPEGG